MDNTLTTAELKRRGMAAIEEGLQRGPVHLLKRNRTAAVVVSVQEYRRLTSGQERAVPGMTALQWLLQHSTRGERGKREIDAALADERAW